MELRIVGSYENLGRNELKEIKFLLLGPGLSYFEIAELQGDLRPPYMAFINWILLTPTLVDRIDFSIKEIQTSQQRFVTIIKTIKFSRSIL